MDKEKDIKNAITLLEAILNNWKKKNSADKEYCIFFPKFLTDNDNLKALFPIFEKNDNILELATWGEYDLKEYTLSQYIAEENKIIINDTEIVNYTDSKFENVLQAFVKIFYFAQNFKRIDLDTLEYKENIEKLTDSIYEYENILINEVTEELNIIYGYEYTEKFNPYIFPKGSEEKNYDFEWKQTNELKYISDKSLELAYKLLEKGNFSLKILKDAKTEKICVSTNVRNLCDESFTTNELLDILKSKGNKIFTDSKSDFTANKDKSIEKLCYKCEYEKCPKHIAGYILYLRNTGKLKEKLQEREKFRKDKLNINDKYAFVWNVEDGLKKIPQNIFEFAEKLVDKECIYVDRCLTDNGKVKILTAIKCSEYTLYETEEILKYDRKFSDWVSIKRNTNCKIGLCDTFSCRLNSCPILVAGYIQYLKTVGREDLIIADRKYYLENKEEIDLENEKIKSDKIEKMENQKNDYLENLKKEYDEKIINFKDFTDILLNPNQTNLHCTIEGNDNIGKNKFVSEISSLLYKLGKTNKEEYERISLLNLAASNAYSYTNKSNSKVTDINNVLYQVESAVKYTELEEKVLYVVDGIEEFYEDYKKYKNNTVLGGTVEIRKKQFEHTFELLTKINKNNYIIINGTKEEIENLLEIEPRLQFIYKNSRLILPDPSIDEIYKAYIKTLKPDLLEIARKDYEKYKKQFIEYISLNKNFIPLSDIELANYLAIYSNSKKKITFPENIYKKETIEESLKNIIGMKIVKERVAEFEKYMLFQMKAKSEGITLNSTNMHMIFTGNPGTGKTTIARIMAKMLFDLGIIKENKLIEVERKDLIANYIGQTATKTAEVIEKAMGGVLFIDEAYELAGKGERDFGSEAIATLIKAMEDHKDNLVVIFAGYRNEMQTFIDSNPGIGSRIGYTFDFPDYTPNELIQIFYKKMNNMGFEIDKSVDLKLNNICKYFSKRKDFGNGRFVDKLIQEVIMKHSKLNSENIRLITKEDIPEIEDLNNARNDAEIKDTKELLKDIVGMEDLKRKVIEFEQYMEFLKEAEKHKLNIPNQNMHMIFTGNPGTGKTTIARIMAKMLRDLGIVHENKLIEVERKDLVAEYIGQTAKKTSEVINRAMGGVLFIDEAYALAGNKNDFGSEAITTLIKAMEDHKGEFIVIFAGYKKEMKDFIAMNSGIASRIGYTFDFQDYTDKELAEILYKKIYKAGMSITEDSKENVEKIMKYFANVENIGNGRFVDKVLQEILMKHAKNENKKIGNIQKEDIPTIKEMTSVIFAGKGMIDVEKITEEDLKKTAVHEIGHACIRLLLFKEPGIKKITINPEGTGTLGYVRHSGNTSYTSSKTTLLNNIKVSLGGMAAEQLYFGEFENGNTSDLEHASYIAKNMITKYGMSDLGLGQIINPDNYLTEKVQEEMNKILKQCYDETLDLIKNNMKKVDKVVEYLLVNKEIDEEELIKNFK